MATDTWFGQFLCYMILLKLQTLHWTGCGNSGKRSMSTRKYYIEILAFLGLGEYEREHASFQFFSYWNL
jgi:hypothetical protein